MLLIGAGSSAEQELKTNITHSITNIIPKVSLVIFVAPIYS
jgi:hypothetical protein